MILNLSISFIFYLSILSDMWSDDEEKRLLKVVDNLKDWMINTQKKITDIPAISPDSGGEGERDRAEHIKSVLKSIGFDKILEFNAPDKRAKGGHRPNIIAIIKGKKLHPKIWIMTHMDTVPPGDLSLWKTNPFVATVKDGRIYGRGTEDNQQDLVASIASVKALKEADLSPEYDVGLVMVSDEETGSKYGLSYLIKNHNIFNKEDIILVPDAGDEKGTMIEVAEKSILWLKFLIKGKQVHASEPNKGNNAHRIGAELLCDLDKNLHKKFREEIDLFGPPLSTFEPTKKEANVSNINTIPGEDVFYMDCRVLPSYSLDSVIDEAKRTIQKIEDRYNADISLEIVHREDAAPSTPPDSNVVKILKRAILRVTGTEAEPMGIGGGTVASIFRKAGFDAAVWSTIDDVCHQPNEYCVIDNMVNDAKVFATLFGEVF